MKKPLSNYQDLLKTLAIIAVYIDHYGLFFANDFMVLRALGRFAMPIFCFFVGYNYTFPKIRLVFFGGIISLLLGLLLNMWLLNMLIVMYIGQWYLYLINKYRFTDTKWWCWVQLFALLIIMPFSASYFEYGTLAIAYILVGHLYKKGAGDYKMLMLITIYSIVFLQYNFHFSYVDGSVSAVILLITSYLLLSCDYNMHTKWDFRIISRNSIFLYFVNLVVSILYFYIFVIYA